MTCRMKMHFKLGLMPCEEDSGPQNMFRIWVSCVHSFDDVQSSHFIVHIMR